MAADSRLRHIAKAITWRVVGTIDTVLLSWLITGSGITGLKIGVAEVVTKMVLSIFMSGLGLILILALME